jgi:hypothetical protein
MKKLVSVLFKHMRLATHLFFCKGFRTRLGAADEAVQAAVAPHLPEFNLWVEREDAVFRWAHKSEVTDKISAADANIDSIMVAINGLVQTGRHSTGSAIKASGDKVYHKLQQYGRITRKAYSEQVGDLQALLEDFAGDYSHDVDNLGMGIQVQLLGVTLNTFVNLLNQRDDERVDKPLYTAEETRKHLEDIYHQMAFIINANAATSEDAAEFITFIEHLNPEIERVNAEVRPAKKNIGIIGRLVIATILRQIYTGLPIIVIPEVYYIEEDGSAVRLWLGKDFEVTYRNNIDVGTAEVTIHGKGDYTGQAITKFNIAREPAPEK